MIALKVIVGHLWTRYFYASNMVQNLYIRSLWLIKLCLSQFHQKTQSWLWRRPTLLPPSPLSQIWNATLVLSWLWSPGHVLGLPPSCLLPPLLLRPPAQRTSGSSSRQCMPTLPQHTWHRLTALTTMGRISRLFPSLQSHHVYTIHYLTDPAIWPKSLTFWSFVTSGDWRSSENYNMMFNLTLHF